MEWAGQGVEWVGQVKKKTWAKIEPMTFWNWLKTLAGTIDHSATTAWNTQRNMCSIYYLMYLVATKYCIALVCCLLLIWGISTNGKPWMRWLNFNMDFKLQYLFKLDQKRKYKRFIHHLMRNLKEIPYLLSEFEYQIRLDHKRQNTYKIPAVFANLTPTKWNDLYIIPTRILRRFWIWSQKFEIQPVAPAMAVLVI